MMRRSGDDNSKILTAIYLVVLASTAYAGYSTTVSLLGRPFEIESHKLKALKLEEAHNEAVVDPASRPSATDHEIRPALSQDRDHEHNLEAQDEEKGDGQERADRMPFVTLDQYQQGSGGEQRAEQTVDRQTSFGTNEPQTMMTSGHSNAACTSSKLSGVHRGRMDTVDLDLVTNEAEAKRICISKVGVSTRDCQRCLLHKRATRDSPQVNA
eukprot:CAMPEP_0114236666 /NCGR_PEP_ID=MMETSP0058-20121206/6967_1 /TAXON_ID=36894 /ORGANISM="Pyramimonas parkeae, CCMP726" /LENGTH=211 /DNA_ID=CAMNT_0001348633 /DNA_START=369 /DNA_END=1007 /DNA_ORIENTATION=+